MRILLIRTQPNTRLAAYL